MRLVERRMLLSEASVQQARSASVDRLWSWFACTLLDREEFIAFLATQTSIKPEVKWGEINESEFKNQYEWSQKNFEKDDFEFWNSFFTDVISFSGEDLLWSGPRWITAVSRIVQICEQFEKKQLK